MFDDTLNDLQRIATYSTSKIALQRLVHVKMLTSVAEAFPLQVGVWACLRPLTAFPTPPHPPALPPPHPFRTLGFPACVRHGLVVAAYAPQVRLLCGTAA